MGRGGALRSGQEIAEFQNSESSLKMLKAQRQLYSEAKRIKGIAAIVCLGIPIVVTVVQIVTSFTLPTVAACVVIELVSFAAGIVFTACAECKIATGASIQQRFDFELYDLGSYDRAGLSKSIVEAAGRYERSSKDFSELLDWYGTGISGLEPIEAVRCCQRMNVSWSYRLGWLWMVMLAFVSLACLAVLVAPAVFLEADIASIFFGATIVEWLTLQLGDGVSYLRQVRDLDKIADAVDIDSKADALRMQDFIFEYRKSRFKVPDFMFRVMRNHYSFIGDEIAASERL